MVIVEKDKKKKSSLSSLITFVSKFWLRNLKQQSLWFVDVIFQSNPMVTNAHGIGGAHKPLCMVRSVVACWSRESERSTLYLSQAQWLGVSTTARRLGFTSTKSCYRLKILTFLLFTIECMALKYEPHLLWCTDY